MKTSKYEMDMCSGPLLKKIITFVIPLMLSGILQLLYNAADIVVVGRFSGKASLAAVGSTGALINLIINIFMGLSVGACVITAQRFGAGDRKALSDVVHTSMLAALICGVVVGVAGFFLARPMLAIMDTPDDVIDKAALYVRIYFAGLPALMLYNFGASILRGIGDTRRPLYFLTASGLVNIVLNVIFVVVFKMDVAGVATATVISEIISAVLVVLVLMRSDTDFKLELKKLRICKKELVNMIKIGLPAGIQGSVFSFSNVIIQSSINSFGSVAMAGNAAASNIEGFIYTSMNAVSQASVTFTGQNFGARRYENLRRILIDCLGLVTVIAAALGALALVFDKPLLGIYSADDEVIQFGIIRLWIICTTYFLCGVMEVFVGMLRGIGRSLTPMIVTVCGVCGIRLLWIFTVFQLDRNLTMLYISYPISWTVTAVVHFICYLAVKKRTIKKNEMLYISSQEAKQET